MPEIPHAEWYERGICEICEEQKPEWKTANICKSCDGPWRDHVAQLKERDEIITELQWLLAQATHPGKTWNDLLKTEFDHRLETVAQRIRNLNNV